MRGKLNDFITAIDLPKRDSVGIYFPPHIRKLLSGEDFVVETAEEEIRIRPSVIMDYKTRRMKGHVLPYQHWDAKSLLGRWLKHEMDGDYMIIYKK